MSLKGVLVDMKWISRFQLEMTVGPVLIPTVIKVDI